MSPANFTALPGIGMGLQSSSSCLFTMGAESGADLPQELHREVGESSVHPGHCCAGRDDEVAVPMWTDGGILFRAGATKPKAAIGEGRACKIVEPWSLSFSTARAFHA